MHTIRNLTLLLTFFCLLPFTILAADDYSIEFVVKDGDSLYRICEKILEDPEDWHRGI